MIITFESPIKKCFPINSIQYELDSNDYPVDIVIRANKDTLEEIASYACLGYNIRELNEVEQDRYECSHEALYARLQPFTISRADKVIYINY